MNDSSTAAAAGASGAVETVEALEAEQRLLEEELKRLEDLERTLQPRQIAIAKTQRADVHDIKNAFDSYDIDESGFIDPSELLLLASSLGELLDDNELKEAMQTIGLNTDGKISFNEFFKWWTADSRLRSAKSGGKLQVLRGKLIAKHASRRIPTLLRDLSESKYDDTVNEWVNHHLMFAVDPVDNPAAFLNFEAKFEPRNDAAFTGAFAQCGFVGAVRCAFRAGSSAETRQSAVSSVSNLLAAFGSSIPFSTTADDHAMTLHFGLNTADPFVLAQSFQPPLDLAAFVRQCSLRLELAQPLSDLLKDDPNRCIAAFVRLKLQADLSFKKSLMYSLLKLGPAFAPSLIFALLEHTKLEFEFGSLLEVLRTAQTPEGLDYTAALARQQGSVVLNSRNLVNPQQEQANHALAQEVQRVTEEYLREYEKVRPKWARSSFYLQKGFQAGLRKDLHDTLVALIAGMGLHAQSTLQLIKCLKENFSHLSGVCIYGNSGLRLDFQTQGLVTADLLPAVAVAENGELRIA